MMMEDGAQLEHYCLELVRLARDSDLAKIRALMAPHVRAGVLRERAILAHEFLVSGQQELVGCVALSPWTDGTLELGSLVSTRKGQGSLLVLSALELARELGAQRVVCLTGVPGFFERLGFCAIGDGAPPHRQCAQDPAVQWKASRCALCPDAGRCTQSLMEVWL